jgi:putative flippase GtrA
MIAKMVKYGFVGLLGTVLHFTSLLVLVEALHMKPVPASTLGFILVLVVSYILNYKWTFQVQSQGWKPVLKYIVVSGTGLFLNTGIIYITVDLLQWHYLIGQCFVIVIVPLSNFLFNYYWTFQIKPEAN